MTEYRKYKVLVDYVFSGYFLVESGSKEEAEKLVDTGCGMVGSIQTTLSDNELVDYEFPVHPESVIKSIDSIERGNDSVCPECGGELHEYAVKIGARQSLVTVLMALCTECDWVTIFDFYRDAK